MGGACVDIARKSVRGADRCVREYLRHPLLFGDVPGRTGAPCRVELLLASEVGTAVGPDRSVHDNGLADVEVCGAVEGSIARFGEILPVEPFHLAEPLVGRPADRRHRRGAGHGVIVVSLGIDCVGFGAAELCSCKKVEGVSVRKCVIVCKMPPGHIAVAVGPVLRNAAVEVGLGLVVVAEAVAECRVGVLVHHLVRGIARE